MPAELARRSREIVLRITDTPVGVRNSTRERACVIINKAEEDGWRRGDRLLSGLK